VLPTTAEALPSGTRVEVTGVVRAPERAADERYPEPPPVTLTDLLDRSRARAFIERAEVSVIRAPS
jgi:hypothetical protein